MIELTEAKVKKDVEDYLKISMEQGKLWYERLNAGTFGRHHNIQGAKKGTADFIVVQAGEVRLEYLGGQLKTPVVPVAFVTFIECKSTDGKQKQIQAVFEDRVTKLHCRYVIVRDVAELPAVLERV